MVCLLYLLTACTCLSSLLFLPDLLSFPFHSFYLPRLLAQLQLGVSKTRKLLQWVRAEPGHQMTFGLEKVH